MQEFRERNAGLSWTAPAAVVVAAIAIVAAGAAFSAGAPVWVAWVVWVPSLVLLIYGGLRPLVYWLGTELRIDDRGVLYGSERVRRKPAQITYAARNPYAASWPAIREVRLVRDPQAVREMVRQARPGWAGAQPSVWLGYFPVRGRAALVLDVDLPQVTLPEVRPAARRRVVGDPGADLQPSSTWVFPVRDAEAVKAAFAAHAVAVTEQTVAVSPDDGSSLEAMARRLGRPLTLEEIEDWERGRG